MGSPLTCWYSSDPQQAVVPADVIAQAAKLPTATAAKVPVAGAPLTSLKASSPQQVTPGKSAIARQDTRRPDDKLALAVALQGEQAAPPGGDVVPAGQAAQTALLVAPLSDDAVPAGQLLQAGDPSDMLNVPCNHVSCSVAECRFH